MSSKRAAATSAKAEAVALIAASEARNSEAADKPPTCKPGHPKKSCWCRRHRRRPKSESEPLSKSMGKLLFCSGFACRARATAQRRSKSKPENRTQNRPRTAFQNGSVKTQAGYHMVLMKIDFENRLRTDPQNRPEPPNCFLL
ncbi:hypothetical protein B0H17DRAFT_1145955 [Mycena rosella]|uniref:Uncharacterized protein n=1 Tax=Mycena rosella TaxID=1033263 RepID=A0AAD7G1A9_MYCRO|nr:hypothetical protein B0H17DRAFT_1145955 [Mycena rosella]